MFNQVSWSNYFITIGLLSAGYYVVIGYLYYRHDLLQLLSDKKITTNNHEATIQNQELQARSFIDEFHAFMQQAANEQMGKEDILQSVQLLLNKYPAFKDSSFRKSIKNLVIDECRYCSIHLSVEELDVLWN
jgi:hypothetical protein